MTQKPPAPDSFRKIIHDINQIVFLMRGNCELARTTALNSSKLGEHLQTMEAHLDELALLAKRLKKKQLELAKDE